MPLAIGDTVEVRTVEVRTAGGMEVGVAAGVEVGMEVGTEVGRQHIRFIRVLRATDGIRTSIRTVSCLPEHPRNKLAN